MPRKPVIFLFSGQGSHYYGMGRNLLTEQLYFRAWMERGDRLIKKMVGLSLLDALYTSDQRPSDPMLEIGLSHPAIFLVEYSLAQTLIEQGLEPDYLLGVSMGNFAALAVAGVLSFEDALLAVIKQVEVLQQFCLPGGMLAILGAPHLYEQSSWLQRQSTLAGINFDKHFVIAADQEVLGPLCNMLQQENLPVQKLPVSFGFHSPAMDPAAAAYCTFLQRLPRQTPAHPLICSIQATTLIDPPWDYLWRVTREPMRFRDTVMYLEEHSPWTYVALGPSSTLATFVKYNLPSTSQSEIYPIMTPFGQDIQNLELLLKSDIGR